MKCNAVFRWDDISFSSRISSNISRLSLLSLMPGDCETLTRASQAACHCCSETSPPDSCRYIRLVLSISSMLSGSILAVSHNMNLICLCFSGSHTGTSSPTKFRRLFALRRPVVHGCSLFYVNGTVKVWNCS